MQSHQELETNTDTPPDVDTFVKNIENISIFLEDTVAIGDRKYFFENQYPAKKSPFYTENRYFILINHFINNLFHFSHFVEHHSVLLLQTLYYMDMYTDKTGDYIHSGNIHKLFTTCFLVVKNNYLIFFFLLDLSLTFHIFLLKN